MTHVFKKSMMVAGLVAAIAAVQTGDAMAQPFTPSGPNEAQVILFLGSGEVTVDIGSDVFIVLLETLNTTDFFDNTAVADTLNELEQNFGVAAETDGTTLAVRGLPLPTGVYNFGSLIPEGSRTVDALTAAGFNFGFGGLNFSREENGIGNPSVILVEAIPEPSSVYLLALGGLTAVARRRK